MDTVESWTEALLMPTAVSKPVLAMNPTPTPTGVRPPARSTATVEPAWQTAKVPEIAFGDPLPALAPSPARHSPRGSRNVRRCSSVVEGPGAALRLSLSRSDPRHESPCGLLGLRRQVSALPPSALSPLVGSSSQQPLSRQGFHPLAPARGPLGPLPLDLPSRSEHPIAGAECSLQRTFPDQGIFRRTLVRWGGYVRPPRALWAPHRLHGFVNFLAFFFGPKFLTPDLTPKGGPPGM